MHAIDKLIRAATDGEKIATAQLISMVERGDPQADYIMEKISPHTGGAYIIGVTGAPGAGKSTLVDRLVSKFCRAGCSVGVVAVDPSSPFGGGALLGDRIRMNVNDKGRDLFFRSMSAGRVMGGLARTTREAAKILDASGRQIIFIETVGVGQSELDIAKATDTVLVVLTPESGDNIQMMKAGLLEIADVFAINKSDRPGAESISQSLQENLDRSSAMAEWTPPIFLTAASLNQGVDALHEGLLGHKEHLEKNGRMEKRRKSQLKEELRDRIEESLSDLFWQATAADHDLDRLVEDLWSTKSDPRKVAGGLVSTWLQDKS